VVLNNTIKNEEVGRIGTRTFPKPVIVEKYSMMSFNEKRNKE
jgi:hypothetical protein